jgi:hypothetical protein
LPCADLFGGGGGGVMAREKSQSYSGVLRTPIIVTEIPDPHFNTIEDMVEDELRRKFVLLLKHYKIEPNLPAEQIFFALSLELAYAHVPGFNIIVPKRKGRKKRWDLAEARRIVAAVDAHKGSKGIKVAIKSAIEQKDWKWGRNTSSIETRYYEAKRQIMQYELAMKHPPFSAERLLAYCSLPSRSTKT